MKLTAATRILPMPERGPVLRAARALLRDIAATCLPGGGPGADILLERAPMEPEQYRLAARGGALALQAGDDLGFIYGLYRVSRDILGVTPFWFWNDQPLTRLPAREAPDDYAARSAPCRVRYRGWFINDEVLLSGWKLGGRAEGPWEMAFEALLRLGGNMVIPGTDENARRYRALAADFGLYITHHHAEPLGARMFSRAYPDLTPSYDAHPARFEGLWREAVEAQRGTPTVWNAGFRGQGDAPFWEHDARYETPEARGALLSRLIARQVELVRESCPGAPCCTNLYGEAMALYREGFLTLPPDVIRIYADNGYGKMVSRRQGNDNPRVSALAQPGERGKSGLYYHVSFYDLQAGNHMTPAPAPPEFVRAELTGALARGMDAYWIVNCSNVKPHAFMLDYIAALWRDGDADPEAHLRAYAASAYGEENAQAVCACMRAYWDAAVLYGAHEDDRAGDQFAHHGARMLVTAYLRDARAATRDMRWATDAPDLAGQIAWYEGRCEEGSEKTAALLARCEAAALSMAEPGRTLFGDTLQLHAKFLSLGYEGARLACESLRLAQAEDWLRAFYAAGRSRQAYLAAYGALREREHGHWRGFYANECLTDARQSAYVMGVLMGVLRSRGDGPHYYGWQRRFAMAPQDANILLILRPQNHLSDDDLFELMLAREDEVSKG